LVRYVARMGENRNLYSVFVRKPKGKRPFTRPRRKRNNNIKTYVNEIRRGIHLAQNIGQLEGPVKYGNKNLGFINCFY
jgi:hypothetical protein